MGAFCRITPVLKDILDLCRFALTYLTPPRQNFMGAFHHVTPLLLTEGRDTMLISTLVLIFNILIFFLQFPSDEEILSDPSSGSSDEGSGSASN